MTKGNQTQPPQPETARQLQLGASAPAPHASVKEDAPECPMPGQGGIALSPQQCQAAHAGPKPLFVRGATGTGKTTLVAERALHLLDEGIAPSEILIITPTRHGAARVEARMAARQPGPLPRADSLYALALEQWHHTNKELPVLLCAREAYRLFLWQNTEEAAPALAEAWGLLQQARTGATPVPEHVAPLAARYNAHKRAWNLVDEADLLHFWHNLLETAPATRAWSQVLVDDAQCFTPLELEMIVALAHPSGEGFFAVADLTQPPACIPGYFPGHMPANDSAQCQYTAACSPPTPEVFLHATWPHMKSQTLTCNYRSLPRVVRLVGAVLEAGQTPEQEKNTGQGKSPAAQAGKSQNHRAAHTEPEPNGETHAKASTGTQRIMAVWEATEAGKEPETGNPVYEGANALLPMYSGREGTGLAHLLATPSEDLELGWIAEQLDHLLVPLPEPASIAGNKKNALAKHLRPGAYAQADVAIIVRRPEFAARVQQALARHLGDKLAVLRPDSACFWHDARVTRILHLAGAMLGIAPLEGSRDEAPNLDLPEKILVKGPLAIAAYFAQVPPFDDAFWHSQPFRMLVKAFDTCGDWAGVFTFIALQTETAPPLLRKAGVPLLTYEEARGKHFGVVFLPGLEDGFVPYAGDILSGKRSKKSLFDVEAERRLFAAAIACARDAAVLTWATRRPGLGGLKLKVSRFLSCLPKGELTSSAMVAQTTRTTEQLTLL